MPDFRGRVRRGYQLGSQIVAEFTRHRGGLLAGALAFHALLSLAPLVIVAVAIAGVVLGRGTAHAEMNRLLLETVGEKGAAAVDEWVEQASNGVEVASFVGIGLMLLAASKLGTRLRDILNQIWDIDADAFIPSFRTYTRRRVVAFALAFAAGPTLLIVFASRTLLTGFHNLLFRSRPELGLLIELLQVALSLAIVACLSAVVFRCVPDTLVSWKNAWAGGGLASVLLNAGNALLGIYLGRASIAAYGAASSVLVVLLWLYFSAHMFLMGAEFTHVYANRFDPVQRTEAGGRLGGHRPRRPQGPGAHGAS